MELPQMFKFDFDTADILPVCQIIQNIQYIANIANIELPYPILFLKKCCHANLLRLLYMMFTHNNKGIAE